MLDYNHMLHVSQRLLNKRRKYQFKRKNQGYWLSFNNSVERKANIICIDNGNSDKYDNYNAINIDKVSDMPLDYKGIMGVPITFIDKYNPDQFEIVGQMVTTKIDEFNHGYPYINGKKIYARILIRNKKV